MEIQNVYHFLLQCLYCSVKLNTVDNWKIHILFLVVSTSTACTTFGQYVYVFAMSKQLSFMFLCLFYVRLDFLHDKFIQLFSFKYNSNLSLTFSKLR